MATKLSVMNFKGGVGKTTLAFHLAAYLARQHKVLCIDVDHQASLSLVMLGTAYNQFAVSGKTTNEIFATFCEQSKAMPGDEIIVKNPLHVRDKRYNFYPNLDLVPAQLELDDTEIELASTTYGSPAKSEWIKRSLLARWLDDVNADKNYDFIIFDCAPATKLVTQNAIAASKYFLVPVIPDEVSTRGVTHLVNLVSKRIDGKINSLKKMANVVKTATPRNYIGKTTLAGIVPFMIKPAGRAQSGKTNLHTTQLTSLRNQWGNDLLKNSVRSLTGYAESMSNGWPVYNQGWNRNVSGRGLAREMTGLCAEIETRLK